MHPETDSIFPLGFRIEFASFAGVVEPHMDRCAALVTAMLLAMLIWDFIYTVR